MAQDNILNILRAENKWLKSREIHKKVNISFPALSKNLHQMVKYKDIKKQKSNSNSFEYHW